MATMFTQNFDRTNQFSDTCAQIALGVGVEQTYTVPGTEQVKYTARFTYTQDSNVFVCLNATPVVPGAGTVGVQPYNEYRVGCEGDQRNVKGGDVIHFITPDATAYVGLSLRVIVQ